MNRAYEVLLYRYDININMGITNKVNAEKCQECVC